MRATAQKYFAELCVVAPLEERACSQWISHLCHHSSRQTSRHRRSSPPYPPQPAQYPQMAYPPQPQQPTPPYVGQPPLPPGYQQPYMMQPPHAPPPPGQPAPPAGQPLAAKKVVTTPSAFRKLFRVATLTSILSTIAFVVYVFTPRATAAQLTHAHPYYLAGLIGLAIAEACQLLAILVLIGHWASHFNTEKRFREIFVLLISLIPFMVVIIFLWTLIVYLRARRQNPASDETEQHKQELKEQAVNTLIDAGTNRSSAMAGSQTPALPAAGRPTLRDTVRRVIGPSTERCFS